MDDEQHAIDVLTAHASKVPQLEIMLSTTNPIEAYDYLKTNPIDLIFLDIQMAELTGLQLLNLINGKIKVILTTAYPEHALDGYEYSVTDFLLKPILFPRFFKAVSRLTEGTIESDTKPTTEKGFIFVKTGVRNKVMKVEFDKIVYVESMGNYVHFILSDSKITTLMTLKDVEAKLPANEFIRIHQSYLVAIKFIYGKEGNQLMISDKALPIGDTYKSKVLEFISRNTHRE